MSTIGIKAAKGRDMDGWMDGRTSRVAGVDGVDIVFVRKELFRQYSLFIAHDRPLSFQVRCFECGGVGS